MLGVRPAQQGLELDHLGVDQTHHRLVVQLQFAARQRLAQVLGQRQMALRLLLQGGGEVAEAVAAQRLGLVHGLVGVLHQVAHFAAVVGEQRDADRGADEDSLALQFEGLAQQVEQLLRHRLGLLGLFERRQQHGELVATQARAGVTGTQGAADAFGGQLQQAVAGGVPQRVVDLLEQVEVEVEQRQPVAVALGVAQLLLQAVVEQATVGQAGQRIEVRLLPDQRLLRLLLRDVGQAADEAADAALRPGLGLGLHKHPQPLAVGAQEAVLAAERAALRHAVRPGRLHGLALVGVQALHPGVPERLFGRDAQQLRVLGVHKAAATLGVGAEDADRHHRTQGAVGRLAGPQRFGGGARGADVLQHARQPQGLPLRVALHHLAGLAQPALAAGIVRQAELTSHPGLASGAPLAAAQQRLAVLGGDPAGQLVEALRALCTAADLGPMARDPAPTGTQVQRPGHRPGTAQRLCKQVQTRRPVGLQQQHAQVGQAQRGDIGAERQRRPERLLEGQAAQGLHAVPADQQCDAHHQPAATRAAEAPGVERGQHQHAQQAGSAFAPGPEAEPQVLETQDAGRRQPRRQTLGATFLCRALQQQAAHRRHGKQQHAHRAAHRPGRQALVP